MSVARGLGQNGGHFYSNITKPVKLDLSFVVDSSNANGLGISSLKSNGYVANVFMNTISVPAGSPAFGTARGFAALGASAVTNTGNTVLTGNLGITPGSAITGFPPGTFSGVEHIADVAAAAAKASAQASYTDLQARTPTIIAAALDGQTLTPGVYKSAGGTFTLASAGAGTLTLNGAGVYVFQTTSTLVTGAGGTPTITLSGGALASNVYWAVGSSATINSGFTGVFKGNIIANTSITDTLGGTVLGSLVALNGAVTFSAATIGTVQPLSGSPLLGNPNPAAGYAMIKFNNNFNKYIGEINAMISPNSGVDIAINSTNLVLGQPYVISSLGTSTAADWLALGLPAGFTAAVGQSFVAIKSGNGAGSGKVQSPLVSGINSVEVIGDPNLLINNSQLSVNGGAILLLQFLANSIVQAPADGSVVSLSAFYDASSVTIDGL